MSFVNFRQNLKNRKMPIVQVVIASFLFIVISDKAVFNNFFNYLQNMQLTNPESVFTSVMNFSRILSLQYSVALGIGYLFLELARAVAVSIALLAVIKHIFSFERVEVKEEEVVSAFDRFHTNDIYLQTSKFIC